ncbi:MAG: hypothetical protein M3N38_09825, partial [Pseudomonadota bacterium]|nr:hypothetical protein [Pseudomonadota bacterium]
HGFIGGHVKAAFALKQWENGGVPWATASRLKKPAALLPSPLPAHSTLGAVQQPRVCVWNAALQQGAACVVRQIPRDRRDGLEPGATLFPQLS